MPFSTWQAHVLGCERPHSLSRLLDSLISSHYHGSRVDLHIHLDGGCRGPAAAETVDVAYAYSQRWSHGSVNVSRISPSRGIRAAWLGAWSPSSARDRAIILEDDIELSPWWFKWLSAAHDAYVQELVDAAPILAGFALNRLATLQDGRVLAEMPPGHGPMLSRTPSAWAFAPDAAIWRAFLSSAWATGGRVNASSMRRTVFSSGDGKNEWLASFAAFCAERGGLTLYPRVRPDGQALAVNWREPGAHFNMQNKGLHAADSAASDFDRMMLLEEKGTNVSESIEGLLHFPPLSALSLAEDYAFSSDDPQLLWLQRRSSSVRRALLTHQSVLDAYANLHGPDATPSDQRTPFGWDDIWRQENLKLQELLQPSVGQIAMLSLCTCGVLLFIGSSIQVESHRFAPLMRELSDLRPTLLLALEGIALVAVVHLVQHVVPTMPQTHEPLRFWAVLLVGLAVALLWRRPINEVPSGSLGRELTTEWRGWMQIVFVCYHYFAMWDLMHIIRLLVSAYVWMTVRFHVFEVRFLFFLVICSRLPCFPAP